MDTALGPLKLAPQTNPPPSKYGFLRLQVKKVAFFSAPNALTSTSGEASSPSGQAIPPVVIFLIFLFFL